MYIPDFWCGVAVTIIVEVAALIAASIVYNKKKPKRKDV